MTFGLGVYSPVGVPTYSSDDVTWNQVDMMHCPGNVTTSGTFDALSGRELLTVQMMINPPPVDRRAIAHDISVSGTTVTVSGGSEDTYVLVLMR